MLKSQQEWQWTPCLSWSTATLDATLAFKDAVHTHLSTWTLSASQPPHLVLHCEHSHSSQDWREEVKNCVPASKRTVKANYNHTRFSLCVQLYSKRKRPVWEVTSSWSHLNLPDQYSPLSSTHCSTHSRKKRDQGRLGLTHFLHLAAT